MKLWKIVSCFGMAAIHAQTATEVDLKFEVATIRPSPLTERGYSINPNPGSFRARNVKVQQLIQFTYGIQDYQVIGGSGWVRTEGYAIVANFELLDNAPKLSSAAALEQMRSRVRNLLKERFRLKLREEMKELPIYSIILVKSRHKLKVPDSGEVGSIIVNQNNGSGTIRATSSTLKSFADSLGNILGRPVVNETGLDETFDFDLTWSSDLNSAADQSGPSIFTALQEQLGLKLESKKGPVKVYVIEQVNRPTEN